MGRAKANPARSGRDGRCRHYCGWAPSSGCTKEKATGGYLGKKNPKSEKRSRISTAACLRARI